MGFIFESSPDAVSFETTTGTPKARLRSTYERRLFTTSMELTGDQVATFETFWADIHSGIDEFEWVDPVTGNAALFVFQRAGNVIKKPRWQLITGGAHTVSGKTSYELRRYTGTLELEYTGLAPE